MSSLSDIITVGRSGILSQQERLNVIGHNITNSQTKGYHRQQAILSTNPANMPNLSTTRPYSQGTGVTVKDVIREFDMLREQALLEEKSDAALHEHLAKMLPDIESILQPGTDSGVSEALTEFWTAWQDVASYPDNITMRNVLLEKAGQLTDQLSNVTASLDSYRAGIAGGVPPNATGAVVNDLESFNEATAEIAKLNDKITRYQATRVSTADLEDRRDLLVRDLSEMAEIDVDADYNITLDGQTLVSSNGSTQNDLTLSSSDPMVFDVAGTAVNMASGKLGAWSQLGDYIETLNTNLDSLANTLITQVNALHVTGYDLAGNPGEVFFTGTGADDIAVNTNIYNPDNPQLNNPELVAAAATLHDPGGPNEGPNTGDGANALAIADLARTDMAALNNQTCNEFYIDLTTNLGTRIQSEENIAADSARTMQMLEDAIQSETGVNLDEELIDMITAQRAYQAAAKVVSQTNQLFDVILSLK
jgi:flagellar hook-associated protein 1 FlgK